MHICITLKLSNHFGSVYLTNLAYYVRDFGDWFSQLVLGGWCTLPFPVPQLLHATQVQQSFQATDVVGDNGEVLVLYCATHL